MKQHIIKIVLFAVIFCFSSAINSLHLVHRKDDLTRPLTSKEISVTDLLLATYDWPSSATLLYDINGHKKSKLFDQYSRDLYEQKKVGETVWLSQKVAEKFPHLDVMWIPNTIWDLFRLSILQTDKNSDVSLSDVAKKQMLIKKFLETLKESGVLSDTLRKPDFSKDDVTRNLVLTILKNFRKLPVREELSYLNVLRQEIPQVENKTSMILGAIDKEIAAHNNNEVVLFRTSAGIALKRANESKLEGLALDLIIPVIVPKDPRQKLFDQARKYIFDAIKEDYTQSVADIVAQMPKELLNAWNDPPKATPAINPERINVQDILVDIPRHVQAKTIETLDLSYSYSLFSGCGDPGSGICTYLYAIADDKPGHAIVYGLSLSKNFLHNRGNQIFYLPQVAATDMIFTRQTSLPGTSLSIFAHPRMRRVGDVRRQQDIGLGAEVFALKNFKSTCDALLSQLPKSLLYAQEMQRLISDSAVIVAIDRKNTRSKEMKDQAEQLLRNQKMVTMLLNRAIGSIAPFPQSCR